MATLFCGDSTGMLERMCLYVCVTDFFDLRRMHFYVARRYSLAEMKNLFYGTRLKAKNFGLMLPSRDNVFYQLP